MTHGLIAVTGASGTIGRLLSARLAEAGARQRLIGRDPARLPELTGAETAIAPGFGDPEAMTEACRGAHTLFLVSAHESADRLAQHRTAVNAAVRAGVERIVYLSFLRAAPEATFTFARDHWHTEQYIRAKFDRFTFLRDSFYLSVFAMMTEQDDVIRGPAGDGRVAAVAHEDVADAAAAVLLDDSGAHDGLSYDLTGPSTLNFTEASATLSRVVGRTISYEPQTREQAYASRAGYGAQDWELDGWVSSYEAIGTGEMDLVSDAVPKLTGHQAQDLASYLERNPANYAHLLR